MSGPDEPDPESGTTRRPRMPTPSLDSEYARVYLERMKAGKAMQDAQDHDNDMEEDEASQQTQHTENEAQNAPESDGNNDLEGQPEVAENTNIAHSLVRKKKVTAHGLEDGAEKPNEIREPVVVSDPVEVNVPVPVDNSAEHDAVVEANNPMKADQPEQGHNNSAEKQDDNRSAISVGNDDDDDLFGDRQLDQEKDQHAQVQKPPQTIDVDKPQARAETAEHSQQSTEQPRPSIERPNASKGFPGGAMFCGRPLNFSPIIVPQIQRQRPQVDDDDDLMIIEPNEVADHIKAMFASRSKPMTADDDLAITDVRVKREPAIPTIVIEDVPEHSAPDAGAPPEAASHFLEQPLSQIQSVQLDVKKEGVNPTEPAALVIEDTDDAHDERMFVDEDLNADPAPGNGEGSSNPQGPTPMDIDAGNGTDININDGDQAKTAAGDLNDALDGNARPANEDDGDDDYMEDEDRALSNGKQSRIRRRKAANQKKKAKTQQAAKGQDDSIGDDEDELALLEDELEVLKRRQAKGKLVPREVQEMKRKLQRLKQLKGKNSANGKDSLSGEVQDSDDEQGRIEDELVLLEAELKVFERHQAKGKITRHELQKMKRTRQRVKHLKGKFQSLTEKQLEHETQEFVNENLRRLEEEVSEGNDSDTESTGGRAASRIPSLMQRPGNGEAGPGPSTEQRKRAASRAAGPQLSKKQKTDSGAKKGRGIPKIRSELATMLGMLQADDPIYARARMNDAEALNGFTGIDANTVKEQLRQMKEQTLQNPNEARKRIEADFRSLNYARRLFGGRKYIKAKNGQWWIKGMTKLLHHYQLVGAGWMIQRERHEAGPFGGILADHLGLGKTIEALACIVGNEPNAGEKAKHHGTLIVVPPNLQAQWQDEIETCCPDLVVMQYHSSRQFKVRDAQLRKADIVVTSYSEVMKAYPSKDKVKDLDNLEEGERMRQFNAMLGKLFEIDWYRIILDEAHSIKNHHTHTFKACNQLVGKFRWALTATPVHNGLHEFYPYYQFIRAKPEMTSKVFRKKIGAKDVDSLNRDPVIKEFLGGMILHRRLETLFLGKCLFKIPKTHPLPCHEIDLSEEETVIYRRIESKIREGVNRQLADQQNQAERKKALKAFMTLALRLRQAATHPYMLFGLMRDFFELEDIRFIRTELAGIQAANPNRKFVDQIGRYLVELESKPFGRSKFGKDTDFNLDPQLEKLEKTKHMGVQTCRMCSGDLVSPRKTRCGHVFCRECLENLIQEAREQKYQNVCCPTCKKKHDLSGPKCIMIDLPVGAQSGPAQARRSNGNNARNNPNYSPDMPGNDANGFQPLGIEDGAGFLNESDTNIALSMAPSSKLARVKDIILDWQRKYPDDKIIVFTQWVMVARILGRVLSEERIKFLYYFGEMSLTEKNTNIDMFKAPEKNVKVLVASLKCGGQGLNLTCANRVIMVDLWWNTAVEQQAYGRVFRMGQTKETWYIRVMTKKTIDGRMARLQKRKLAEIQSGFQDSDPNATFKRLEEVAECFGRAHRDASGRVVEVMSDYDDDEERDDDDEDEGNDGGGRGGGGGVGPGGGDGGGGDRDNTPGSSNGGGDMVDAYLPPDEALLQHLANFNNGYGVQEHINLT